MEDNRVFLFCKGNVSAIPPVYNSAISLANIGYEVVLVCGEIGSETLRFLRGASGKIFIVNLELGGYSKLEKIFRYRTEVVNRYRDLVGCNIWFATFDTALSLYNTRMYKNNKFILSVLELYDSAPTYIRFFLRKIIGDAGKIVVPEFNRACIMRVWYDLKKTPIVLPNKPYIISNIQHKTVDIEAIISDLKQFAGIRKIVLYQGLITHHRGLESLSRVLHLYKDKLVFVLIGPIYDNYFQVLKQFNSDSNIRYLGNFDAPNHLHITRCADIGILKYDFLDLNNIYCAPNKIWEYSAFSMPLLGNDIPGLKFYIEKFSAGVTVDFDSEKDLLEGFATLLKNFSEFSLGSKRLFMSVDYDKVVRSIVH